MKRLMYEKSLDLIGRRKKNKKIGKVVGVGWLGVVGWLVASWLAGGSLLGPMGPPRGATNLPQFKLDFIFTT